MPEADDLQLRAGTLRAIVSPRGASLRRLWFEPATGPHRDLIWGYDKATEKRGGQGDVLMPFPGRIAQASYEFAGQQNLLEANDKDGPNAIHGFVRNQTWDIGPSSDTIAQFRTQIQPDQYRGYPFALDIVLAYELLPAGLTCAFVIRNTGASPAPVGAGFHPYLQAAQAVDATTLRIPASHVVEFENLLPTGRVNEVTGDVDFRQPRPVDTARLNHCYTNLHRDPDGFARVHFGDVELWMDKSFPYLVAYTGDALGPAARQALAIEPMTCATDAYNRPEWGLRSLEPGAMMTGTWGIGPAPRRE